jgi:hypothetical protein
LPKAEIAKPKSIPVKGGGAAGTEKNKATEVEVHAAGGAAGQS